MPTIANEKISFEVKFVQYIFNVRDLLLIAKNMFSGCVYNNMVKYQLWNQIMKFGGERTTKLHLMSSGLIYVDYHMTFFISDPLSALCHTGSAADIRTKGC